MFENIAQEMGKHIDINELDNKSFNINCWLWFNWKKTCAKFTKNPKY